MGSLSKLIKSSELSVILMPVINNLLRTRSEPESWSATVISLHLTKDKDLLNCSSYYFISFISLLNTDFEERF